MARAPSRRPCCLAILVTLAIAPIAGATLRNQPAIETDYGSGTYYGGASASDVLTFGNLELDLANDFTNTTPPPFGVNDCSGSVAAVAGADMPAAPTLVNDVVAAAQCPAGSDVGAYIQTSGEADSILLYKIKGPGALATSTGARLGGTLHGALSGSLDFGTTENNAQSEMAVYFNADATPRLSGIGQISGSLYAKPIFYSPPVYLLPGGDLTLGDVSDQSTASMGIFAIDRAFQSDLELTGWVATLRTSLLCQANTAGAAGLAMVTQNSALRLRRRRGVPGEHGAERDPRTHRAARGDDAARGRLPLAGQRADPDLPRHGRRADDGDCERRSRRRRDRRRTGDDRFRDCRHDPHARRGPARPERRQRRRRCDCRGGRTVRDLARLPRHAGAGLHRYGEREDRLHGRLRAVGHQERRSLHRAGHLASR